MKKFCEALEEKGITVEDFTAHLGAYLDPSCDEEEIIVCNSFLEEVYLIAAEVLTRGDKK